MAKPLPDITILSKNEGRIYNHKNTTQKQPQKSLKN